MRMRRGQQQLRGGGGRSGSGRRLRRGPSNQVLAAAAGGMLLPALWGPTPAEWALGWQQRLESKDVALSESAFFLLCRGRHV